MARKGRIMERNALNWSLREKLFSEEHMYKRIEAYCKTGDYPETYKALSFMKESHQGQYRKKNWFSEEKVLYIEHPLLMACHAYALGIKKDKTLAAILLHDVCEDCGVSIHQLPVDQEVRRIVHLLTFQVPQGTRKEEAKKIYYDKIRLNPEASIIKILDRCNNVSTMVASFSREKLVAYVDETEKYVYPLMEFAKKECQEYGDVIFLLKYHILSIVETIKNMLLREM